MNPKINMKPFIPALMVVGFLIMAAALIWTSLALWRKVGSVRVEFQRYVSENKFMNGILQSTHLAPITTRLVDLKRVSVVKDAIIRVAQQNGIDIRVLKQDKQKSEPSSGYDRVFFNFTAIATFRDFGSFFEGVRKVPEGLVDVMSMSMVMSDNDPKKVNAEVVLAVFVSK